MKSLGPDFVKLNHLSEREAKILAALIARLTDTSLIDIEAMNRRLVTVDRFIGHIGAKSLRELKMGLRLFEESTLFTSFTFRKFTELSDQEKDDVLRRWQNGFYLQNVLFSAFKEIAALATYTDPITWPEIGYSGPMVTGLKSETWPHDQTYLDLFTTFQASVEVAPKEVGQ